jgi:XTP/dITP diphosphohydrolase
VSTPLERAVEVMDRLRSPGGCPWDAAQTHESLTRYLLEETYEVLEAIETGNLALLREELGDLLLQVLFHARLTQELPAGEAFGIDDVAGDLVDKLVRRHPHVFGDREVSGAAEVQANWDAIKSAEKAGRPPLAGVPLAMAALTLAATLQRKAAKAGVAAEQVAPELAAAGSLDAAAARLVADYVRQPDADTAGALLWTVVAALRSDGVDAESALRARARQFRDSIES